MAEKKFLAESDRRQHTLTSEWLQAVLGRDDSGECNQARLCDP